MSMPPPRVLFLGRSTLDVLYRLDRLPAEDTKVYAKDFHAVPGGPALNAAITHTLLGGEAMLISAVGGGPWAAPVRAELDRHHIQLIDLAQGTAYETPLTTVLISTANSSRTIVNPPISTCWVPHLPILGHGNPQTSTGPTHQQPLPADWATLLLTDGFHLDQTLPFLATCHEAGAALCLDGGSWKPGTAELAPLLTAAICSECFAIPAIDNTPEAFFDWFASRGVPHIALTRGPQPILAWDRGRRFQIEIPSTNVADTLGAGDVLHGAFAHHFALNPHFEPALRRAAQIATFSCHSLGTQAWAAQQG
jgi:sugar/nucleoside kinase (ribokinase family)